MRTEPLPCPPAAGASLIDLSRAYTAAGRHAQAIEAAHAACRDDPANPYPARVLAEAQLAAGLIAEAEAGLRIAVELAGYDADLHVAHGIALFAAGRPLSAREAFARALRLDPGHQPARAALARMAAEMRTVTSPVALLEATEAFAASLRVQPATFDLGRYAARVVLACCLAALLGVAAVAWSGLVVVPPALLGTLLCVAGVTVCLARLQRLTGPTRS